MNNALLLAFLVASMSTLSGCSLFFGNYTPKSSPIEAHAQSITDELFSYLFLSEGEHIALVLHTQSQIPQAPCDKAAYTALETRQIPFSVQNTLPAVSDKKARRINTVIRSSTSAKVTQLSMYCALIGEGLIAGRLTVTRNNKSEFIARLFEIPTHVHNGERVLPRGPRSQGLSRQ